MKCVCAVLSERQKCSVYVLFSVRDRHEVRMCCSQWETDMQFVCAVLSVFVEEKAAMLNFNIY